MFSPRVMASYVLVGLLIAAVSAGIALLVIDGKPGGGPGVEVFMPTPTTPPELKVNVSGAVSRPGVYAMKEGDRVLDAIAAAGGASAGARLPCVNLALRVRDEAHYHVPGPDEPCQPGLASTSAREDGRTDLNTATEGQLEALPGIGEVRARAIVDYRESKRTLRVHRGAHAGRGNRQRYLRGHP